ncbi:hypothetical protein BVX99_03515 [bacterium F16]|nr:hypothetical protein BVX99_03515 [bacterium F16]
MKIALDRDGTVDGFQKAIADVQGQNGVDGLLILTCYDNGFTPETLDPVLAEIPIPVFGGCFPGIFHQDQVYDSGTVVVGLPVKPVIQRIEDINNNCGNFDDVIDSALFEDIRSGTMVVLVDGMSLRVNTFLESVFNEIGTQVNYIGGGASSMDFMDTPCLITNAGFTQNCAILAYLPMASGVGVAHGMTSVGGPYKVTSSSFNTVKSIEWKPAASFYKETLATCPECDTSRASLIETDAHYSLGLNRLDAERIILEPFKIDQDNALCFMQEVREGEFVDIMHVSDESMIQSAANALTQAGSEFDDEDSLETLITFDCISRKMFLADRFVDELSAINVTGKTHVGALTVGGEIGCDGKDFLDYHNRTCVVGAFGS